MAKDRFPSNDYISLFFGDRPQESEEAGLWKVISSQIIKTTAWVFAAAAAFLFVTESTGCSILLFGKGPTTQATLTAPEQSHRESMPAIQFTASAEAFPTAKDAPPDGGLIAAFENAFKDQAEIDQPTAEALLNQFQAWAAEEDTQAPVRPSQPLRDARAQVVLNDRVPLPKPRPVRRKQIAPLKVPSVSPVQSFSWGN
jgi:hypothetical protein